MHNAPKYFTVKRMVLSALWLAIALLLPLLTGQIQQIGQMLCPMHLPVLLCGFTCGWPWGLAVGFVAPLLRSLIFGMPPLFPGAVAMAAELAVYGLLSGLLRKYFPKKLGWYYLELVIAMIAGRLVWGGVRFLLAGLSGTTFSLPMFWAGAVTSALPGIALQLVLLPPLYALCQKRLLPHLD